VEIIAFDCSGAVRVPDAPVLECANLSTIGGIKVGAVDTLVDPTLGQSDTNIMVEVNTNCQAYVPIPATVITCADATTIGGVKAIENTTLTVMPEVAEEGTYYPVEVVKAPGAASQDECRTIVKVPGGQGASCEDVFKTIDIPAGSFDASGCDDTLTLASPLGTIEITSAVQGTVNFEVSCAEPTVRGGMKVATDNTQTDPTLDETGTAYPVEVNTNCEGFVRVPSAPAEYLLKAVTHSTTITTTTNPSRYTLAQLSASGKNFEQIEFDPASVTGATNQVYAKIERPQNVDNYVKIVVKCTVLTADDDGISDERYLMGLHYSSTDVDGASLSYHYQVTGDYDLDDLTSGDQLNQIQFTWYIPVGDLLNSVGNAATAGEDCYIFVKALYDSTSAVDAPVIILGRQWAINPTITQGTLEAAGPLEICVYEIPDTKYENNPPTPA
jgi:hypothetical protein